ncbi:MAG: acetamidase/formamidase family protein [Thermoanaerobacteraceae bacterium]|nr:acetamidase/formamidase family protein [Thermoanaerobacteraceae bacterium]
MEYRIEKEKCIYNMSANNKPVLMVPSGSTVRFETYDCFEDRIQDAGKGIENIDWEHINPATGPLYVEGARPGDVLKVEILDISINDHGVMAAIPGSGLLGERIEKAEVKIIQIRDGQAVFNNSIKLPISPMIGVIGVAPQEDSIPCGSPGPHGGNMDNTKINKGSILYLPVFVEGSLLAIGDLHACMGDGEIMVTGVEISGSVKARIEVIKDMNIKNPMLEDEENIYTIASDSNLFAAVKKATEDMHEFIMKRLRLSFNEAGMLLSAAGNVQICQVVDPMMTVRFALPKIVLRDGSNG